MLRNHTNKPVDAHRVNQTTDRLHSTCLRHKTLIILIFIDFGSFPKHLYRNGFPGNMIYILDQAILSRLPACIKRGIPVWWETYLRTIYILGWQITHVWGAVGLRWRITIKIGVIQGFYSVIDKLQPNVGIKAWYFEAQGQKCFADCVINGFNISPSYFNQLLKRYCARMTLFTIFPEK